MSRLFVGDISRVVEGDSSILTDSDWRAIEECSAESRRTERFAWRMLLRRSLRRMGFDEDIVSADVVYNSMGAPSLDSCDLFIGVSHSSSKVAVAISHTPCAVDIEITSRDFQRIRGRLLTTEEEELLAPHKFALPLAWATKETLYKLSGVEGLSLIGDMRIEAVDDVACTITCRASRGHFATQQLTFSYTFVDDHVAVWHV